jgi:hypothetical protein
MSPASESADGPGRQSRQEKRSRGGAAAAPWVLIVRVVVCTVSFPSKVTGEFENAQVALVGSPAHENVADPE